jgi:RNA polymerase sigma factor (sigma-70 family)
MTNRKEAMQLLEIEYISKILGFCFIKVNSKEEAENLAQDIVLQVLKSINAYHQIENFNALVWSIANHTFYKWLRSKKYNSTAYLTELHASEVNTEQEFIHREQLNLLHREIAHLSKKYREAIILHYFEGKSCDEIAIVLGKSSGTVKWWLYDARKFIKEGMNTMREYGERSYKPGNMQMSCQGNPGLNEEPMRCAERKSAQNILLAAYKKPVSAEELCVELGIAAPYIEDEVAYLADNQLIKEMTAGKYQTDFVILPGQNVQISDRIYGACFPAYYNELIQLLETNKQLFSNAAFNTAGFSWERLLWVYIHMITDICLCKFKREECKIVIYQDIPDRPNGGKWIALGFESGFPFEAQYEWKQYQPFDGPVHKSGKEAAQGFFHYWSGLDSSVFFDIPDGVFALCRQIALGETDADKLDENQKYLFSIALEKDLFYKNADGFRQNYYFVSENEFKLIENIAYVFYDKAKKYFKNAYDIILSEYASSIPRHLEWQMGNFLSNYLNSFVTCSLYEAYKNKILSKPDAHNKPWLSLFACE